MSLEQSAGYGGGQNNEKSKCLSYFTLTYPWVFFQCLQPPLQAHLAVYDLNISHGPPARFAHFLSLDSPYPPITVVMTMALIFSKSTHLIYLSLHTEPCSCYTQYQVFIVLVLSTQA